MATDRMQIKITEGQKKLLQEIAKKENKTLTKYILDLVKNDLENKSDALLLKFLKDGK